MATDADLNWLRSEWTQLFSSLNVDPDASRQAFEELVEHYSSPGRHYHTLAHIQHVLQTIHSLKDEARDLPAVLLAGWYHDVIYDSKAKDNEEKSAAYTAVVLRRLGICEERVRRVGELILMTRTHEAPADDADAAVLLDADLAILDAPVEEYDRYATAIRREYEWVPEAEYVKGRIRVLTRFLSSRSIYRTASSGPERETRAHHNLEREIASLRDRADVSLMQEREWLVSGDPSRMLTLLRDKASERKLRLFGCGCCHRLVEISGEGLIKNLKELTEGYADGRVMDVELRNARSTYFDYFDGPWFDSGDREWEKIEDIQFKSAVAAAVFSVAGGSVDNCEVNSDSPAIDQVLEVIRWTEIVANRVVKPASLEHLTSGQREFEAGLLREIFGNPFHAVRVDRSWLSNSGIGLANSIYDERAFDRMPILADALEDAGCDNADILEHCRQPGEHVRGCWVVDLILGKS
jgi:predicted metal-dependent HD superfamily phosphohydrolase